VRSTLRVRGLPKLESRESKSLLGARFAHHAARAMSTMRRNLPFDNHANVNE